MDERERYRAWLDFYVTTEEFDRTLPGRWMPNNPDVWQVVPWLAQHSNDFAHRQMQILGLVGNCSVQREVGRLPYTQQVETLTRLGGRVVRAALIGVRMPWGPKSRD